MPEPESLAQLAEFLGSRVDLADSTKSKLRARQSGTLAVPDLLGESVAEKKIFWSWLQEISSEEGKDRSDCDEATVNEAIKFWSGFASRLGDFNNLRQLTVLVDKFRNAGKSLAESYAEPIQDFGEQMNKIGSQIEDTTYEDKLRLAGELGQRFGDAMLDQSEQFGRQLDDTLMTLGQSDESEADKIRACIEEAMSSSVEGLVETIRTLVAQEIDARLGQIHQQLDLLAASQERLEQIHDQLEALTASHNEQKELGEVPPLPTVDEDHPSKKKFVKERERLTGTFDSVLFDLFHQERKARGVTVSRMLDIAFWQRYGKPKLSFEIKLDEAPTSASKEPEVEQE
jgi:hypothetical protein